MNITVIGAGNTGAACCIHLMQQGHQILLYTRSKEKKEFLNSQAVHSVQLLPGEYRIPVTDDPREAVEFGELLIVASWANAHSDIFEMIYRYGDRELLILNGNWGAVEAYQIRKKYYPDSTLCIAETGGMPYISVFSDGTLRVKAIKAQVSAASVSGPLSEKIHSLLTASFRHVTVLKNAWQTSLAAPNPIIHIPLSLFNISRIEHGDDFSLLIDGFSTRAEEYVLGIDAERQALSAKLQVEYQDILSQLNESWGSHCESLTELFRSNEIYRNVRAPQSVTHRFILEDLPYGILPLVNLGKMLQVPVPYCSALTQLFSLYLQNVPAFAEAGTVSFDREALQNIL
ncbi:MAG: NAD/NADP octopine/nopaline dehydrogenase family protein [Lachnospiraceae bacterium]|nr:NAD/NADP octopine/nopaline dehydrogenase family protein [Lachnospiraceae bacterium]